MTNLRLTVLVEGKDNITNGFEVPALLRQTLHREPGL